MKKEKIFIYSLISLFSLCLVVFGAVYFYSDYYFPQKFQEKVCRGFQRGDEISPTEMIAYLKVQKVEDHQIFVRAGNRGNLLPLSSEAATEMITQGDRGALVQIVSVLGLLKKSSCEFLIERHLIQ
ncbi:MAG: hypothetical protein AABY64_05775 [Bdellovibrionota bacterium]